LASFLLAVVLPATVWGYGSYDQRYSRSYVPYSAAADGSRHASSLKLQTGMDESGYYVRAYLKGLTPEDVQVYVRHNRLVFRVSQGDRRSQQSVNRPGSSYWRMSYTRKLRLPRDADWMQMSTTTKDGVLEIHLPRKSRYAPFGPSYN
jgi:HSP20 family molecular chaperone IbpA